MADGDGDAVADGDGVGDAVADGDGVGVSVGHIQSSISSTIMSSPDNPIITY